MCGRASDFDDDAPRPPRTSLASRLDSQMNVSAKTWRAPGASERHIEELNARISILQERLAEERPQEEPMMSQYRGNIQGLRAPRWNAYDTERARMVQLQRRYERELELIHQAEARMQARLAAQQQAAEAAG